MILACQNCTCCIPIVHIFICLGNPWIWIILITYRRKLFIKQENNQHVLKFPDRDAVHEVSKMLQISNMATKCGSKLIPEWQFRMHFSVVMKLQILILWFTQALTILRGDCNRCYFDLWMVLYYAEWQTGQNINLRPTGHK